MERVDIVLLEAALKPAEPPPSAGAIAQLSWRILLGKAIGSFLQVWTISFIGWMGQDALYVRSIYVPIGFFSLAVTDGLVVAVQIAAGMAVRGGHSRRAMSSAPTLIAAGGGLLSLIALIILVGADPILGGLGVPQADRSATAAFIAASLGATVIGLFPLLAAAALRGTGRAGTGSVLEIGYVLVAVSTMALLHSRTDLGFFSVPLGGLAAAAVMFPAAVVLLTRAGIDIPRPELRTEALRHVWRVGLPVGGTFLLVSIVGVGHLHALRSAGPVEINGFSLGQAATGFFIVIAWSIGSATAVAVNMRKTDDRIRLNRAALTTMLRLTIPLYGVIGLGLLVFADPLAGALTTEQNVADVAADYISVVGPTFVLYGGSLAVLKFLEQINMAPAAFMLNVAYFSIILIIVLSLPAPVHSRTIGIVLATGNLIGCWPLLATVWYWLRRSR